MKKYKFTFRGIAFLVFGSLFFYAAFPVKELRPEELTTLKEPVKSGIEIYYGPKTQRSIHLELQKYPHYDFTIGGSGFGAIRASKFVSTAKPGDTLFIDVETEVYNKELIKTVPLSFYDKLFYSRQVLIYGLRDKSNIYMTLYDYNRVIRTHIPDSRISFSVACLLIGTGLWLSIKKTDQPSSDD